MNTSIILTPAPSPPKAAIPHRPDSYAPHSARPCGRFAFLTEVDRRPLTATTFHNTVTTIPRPPKIASQPPPPHSLLPHAVDKHLFILAQLLRACIQNPPVIGPEAESPSTLQQDQTSLKCLLDEVERERGGAIRHKCSELRCRKSSIDIAERDRVFGAVMQSRLKQEQSLFAYISMKNERDERNAIKNQQDFEKHLKCVDYREKVCTNRFEDLKKKIAFWERKMQTLESKRGEQTKNLMKKNVQGLEMAQLKREELEKQITKKQATVEEQEEERARQFAATRCCSPRTHSSVVTRSNSDFDDFNQTRAQIARRGVSKTVVFQDGLDGKPTLVTLTLDHSTRLRCYTKRVSQQQERYQFKKDVLEELRQLMKMRRDEKRADYDKKRLLILEERLTAHARATQKDRDKTLFVSRQRDATLQRCAEVRESLNQQIRNHSRCREERQKAEWERRTEASYITWKRRRNFVINELNDRYGINRLSNRSNNELTCQRGGEMIATAKMNKRGMEEEGILNLTHNTALSIVAAE